MIYSFFEGLKMNCTLDFLTLPDCSICWQDTALILTGVFHTDCSIQKKKSPYQNISF